MRASIQRRLFAILGLFVLANAALWSGVALLIAYMVEDEIIDRMLASQSRLLVEAHDAGGPLPSPALRELRLYTAGEEVPAPLQEHLASGDPAGEIFTADRTHYHYRLIPLSGRAPVVLVAEVSPWLVVRHMSPALLLLGLAALVLATGLGLVAAAWIARMTTRPLRELTAAIAADPRPKPLPHVGSDDEVGVLASSMSAALENLQLALSREQSFTRDVSHELRTPLTTLRNAIQLLPEALRDDPHGRQLERSSEELEQCLTTLLALARAESTALETLRLRPVLEKILLERSDAIRERQLALSLELPDDACARGNRQVTRLLLGNLVDNALHYANPPQLDIRLEGNDLVLENPQAEGAVRSHDHSLRHGLALADRLAAAQSWQLETAQRGALFQARLCWNE